jgi:UDP-GlcNAc3NAcA epimerase
MPVIVTTIVGARPQFVKAAAVHRALRERAGGRITERLLHTGQHYDGRLDALFFQDLDLPAPEANLGVGSGTPGAQIGRMLEGVEAHLRDYRPDLVVVYGDTNSTLAGALAASRLGLPVAHVEAGLRSGDKRMQEESNRVLTDHLSTLLLAPTPTALANLAREGFALDAPPPHSTSRPRVALVGDVMLDHLLDHLDRAVLPSEAPAEPFALVTVHRAEILQDAEGLEELALALLDFARREGLRLVAPLHPAARSALERGGPAARALIESPALRALPPASYPEVLGLLSHAACVLTDSGGLQKEACFLGRPCLVLRDTTEWAELGSEGLCAVAGTTRASVSAVDWRALPVSAERARALFGGGLAAEAVCDALLGFLGEG